MLYSLNTYLNNVASMEALGKTNCNGGDLPFPSCVGLIVVVINELRKGNSQGVERGHSLSVE